MIRYTDIDVTGEDAFEFLQGQLTNDLARLEKEATIATAWCNPKGRVIWFGAARPASGGFRLKVPAEIAEPMLQRLTMFRFRAKVEFGLNEDSSEAHPDALIEAGWPHIGGEQVEQFTPHMLNLDRLDAISLDKGCYTGQEIVARTHYKGKTKRRTLRFSSTEPVSVGAKVTSGDRAVGEVLNAAGTQLLAVIPIDRKDDDLDVAGTPLSLLPLPYDLNSD